MRRAAVGAQEETTEGWDQGSGLEVSVHWLLANWLPVSPKGALNRGRWRLPFNSMWYKKNVIVSPIKPVMFL